MVRIPTPFNVGDVNIYILGDTLIDTGPLTGAASEALFRNVDIASIRKVVITHGHVDHHGLARRIQKISGARVFVHADDMRAVTDYRGRLKQNLGCYKEFLGKSGISKKYLFLFSSYYWYLRKYGEECHAEALGESVETGEGTLLVIPTPGHTPGSCCLLLEDELFSGDTLLPHISTNPSINAVFDERCGIEQYRHSLERIMPLHLRIVHPGHGPDITDHRQRIKQILDEHGQRSERIHSILGREPQTLKQVSLALFGEVSPTEIMLALAECYDHLKMLQKDGRARIDEEGGLYRVALV